MRVTFTIKRWKKVDRLKKLDRLIALHLLKMNPKRKTSCTTRNKKIRS